MTENEKHELGGIYVSLADHFEKIEAERSRGTAMQFKAIEDKLIETAKVLEHRLNVLNHAHEQSISDRGDFARKEEAENLRKTIENIRLEHEREKSKLLESNIFYDHKADLDKWKRDDFGKWKETTDRAITAIDTRYQSRITVSQIVAALSLLVAVASVLVALWRH